MCKIPDRKIRKRALKLNWQELTDTFPDWRRNPVLKKEKGRNAFFMKRQSTPVYKLCGLLMPPVFKLRARRNYK
jgi:hypothetical protein